MIAKVIWNITNTDSGIVAARLFVLSMVTPDRNMFPSPPITLFSPSLPLALKDRE